MYMSSKTSVLLAFSALFVTKFFLTVMFDFYNAHRNSNVGIINIAIFLSIEYDSWL